MNVLKRVTCGPVLDDGVYRKIKTKVVQNMFTFCITFQDK